MTQGPLRDIEATRGPDTHARVLLIADKTSAEHLAATIKQACPSVQLRWVDNGLLALGDAVDDPPDVLISMLDRIDDPLDATVNALRAVAPAARLIAVAKPDHQDDVKDATQAGFDACLLEPIVVADVADLLKDASTPHAPSQTPAPQVAAASNGELQDVDLVRQMVRDHRAVADLALRIVARQSGINGLAIAEQADKVPGAHLALPIQSNGHVLGYLHAPQPASAADLQPWAAWLAEWMGLQRHVGRLLDMAMHDELTGVWNRRYFNQFLGRILHRAASERFRVTVLVFDIDDFKLYNDRYGHAAGDDILREAARLMQSVVRDHDIVARIGGDEFAVIFWDAEAPREPNSEHPMTVRKAAQRFQRAICEHKFPKLFDQAPGTLTISGGIAGFPWDGRTCEELLDKADQMAMQSKKAGKNAIKFGPGAMKTCGLDEA